MPPDKVLYLCTGSQGEPRAALTRIATQSHPQVSLGEGDVVIFSSKIIPGNELAINRLHNRLISLGIEVVTEDDHFVHVSGHPCRDELARMYQWVRPNIAVPVHGEVRHLVEHARLASKLQVPQTVVVENGDMLRLAPGPPKIVDSVWFGRLVADGNALVNAESQIMRTRRRLMYNGVAFVTIVLNGQGTLAADPQITAQGLFDPDQQEREHADTLSAAIAAVRSAISALPARARADDDVLGDAVTTAVRRQLKLKRGKRPIVEVQVVRL